jgi:hypothetical protein
MTGKTDLQIEAYKSLEAFATLCDGREQGEVYDAFIAIVARCLNAAALLLDKNEPEHPTCGLCRAASHGNAAAHELAKIVMNEGVRH